MYVLLAILAGVLFALQPGIDAQLRTFAGPPPRQVERSAGSPGAARARRGSFSALGVEPSAPRLRHRRRGPVSYELTPANVVAEVSPVGGLLAGARLGDGVARGLLGGLAHRSAEL